MNPTVRRIVTSTPLSRRLYFAVRQTYHSTRAARRARRTFVNADAFERALASRTGSALVDLETVDGLVITMRQNASDALTLAEIFLDNCYVRDLVLPPHPVVVDVGGFIGDFSLYAVKRLGARRVIVCEPSPSNWALLVKNIVANGYEDRIEAVNKAVTDGSDVMMDLDVADENQCMVSAVHTDGPHLSLVPGISLGELLQVHGVDTVDLLKIDCEGGEYVILDSLSHELLSRMRNIVFEYHQVNDVWLQLGQAQERLRREGFRVSTRGGLVFASRERGGR